LTLALALAMALGLAGCTKSTTETPPATDKPTTSGAPSTAAPAPSDVSIVLVTMDGLDSHWVNVDKGAQAAAAELGIKYQWMAPDKKDTALQIEML
ncbi:MAG: BMP family ABC transporter substrate-binding protein, partial [Pseudoflavonifractor sp.]